MKQDTIIMGSLHEQIFKFVETGPSRRLLQPSIKELSEEFGITVDEVMAIVEQHPYMGLQTERLIRNGVFTYTVEITDKSEMRVGFSIPRTIARIRYSQAWGRQLSDGYMWDLSYLDSNGHWIIEDYGKKQWLINDCIEKQWDYYVLRYHGQRKQKELGLRASIVETNVPVHRRIDISVLE